MFTKAEAVNATVQIWAIPRQSWQSKDEPPFKYQVYCGTTPYQDGAVKVADVPVTVHVPEGINLLQAAMETLEDAKVKARQTYIDQCAKIDKQMEGLRQLTYQPEPDVLDGEVEVVAPVGGVPTFNDDEPF